VEGEGGEVDGAAGVDGGAAVLTGAAVVEGHELAVVAAEVDAVEQEVRLGLEREDALCALVAGGAAVDGDVLAAEQVDRLAEREGAETAGPSRRRSSGPAA
jgi:hypothetical protein